MIDFMDISQHTARKTHRCFLCGKEIKIGEKYFRHRYKAYGEFHDECYHESCETILSAYFRAHKDDDEWDHCWVTDWIEEYCRDNCEQFEQCGRSVFECDKVRKIIRGASNG